MSVVIAALPLSVMRGDRLQATATVYDGSGHALPSLRPDAWHTSNAGVVSITGSGLITGEALGTATVTATLGALAATLTSNALTITVVSSPVDLTPASVAVTPTAVTVDIDV